jgi:diadenosine tetraphosphatase ApaH/serine/threonine PP2A family protein phosphatase
MAPMPEPERLYVIGDIHGRSDLLDRLTAEIVRDLEALPVASALTVTLGDYVDRGPDSRGVLDRLARNPFPTPLVSLKGNHESLMAAFLEDPTVAGHWRRLGGLETLHSYGVPVAALMMGRDYPQASAGLRAALPASHLAFLASLRTSMTVGRYFLCHAGVRPGVPLERQAEEDLLWIRDEFLSSRANFGKVVVHGHTPAESPEVLSNRINVDTGAFMTGRLTCAVLEEDRVRFLSTAPVPERSQAFRP